MHPSVFFPENLSTNPSISPSHYVYPSFNRHHCSTKRASISQSGNGFFNFQKMVFQSPILSKNYTISIGFYAMASDKLAKECFAKKASISNSAIGFCIPQGMVCESRSVLKSHSYAYGFCTRSCYFRRPSYRNSGYGFCGHEQAFESVKECCAQRASKSSFEDGFFRLRKRASESPFSCRSLGNLSAVQSQGVGIRDDGFYIRRCVEIAHKAIGCTSPNPMVGCVIVKNGKIVGEGFHPKPGQPHAEVFALRNAGELAENATAYVSLEPCNHYGRTPPCTEALIRAKVKHVVVGMVDPNPIVASKGVERLRESGIEVTVGVEEELCRKLNEAYVHRMLTGKPFVTLRYSLSFDGRILNQLGKGVAESGGYYSQLLQEYDGVILSGNALTENFSFPASQEAGANQPLQIIIATSSNSPLHFPTIVTEAITPVIIFRDNSTVMDPTTESNLSQQGIETVVLEQMDLSTILDYCGRCGLCSVLLDLRGDLAGFSEILETGFEEGLFQKVVMEMCPVLGGNEENSSMLALKSFERKSMGLKDLQSRISRGSVLVEGYIR